MPTKPVRSGTYISITGVETAVAPVGGTLVAAVPFQHDWGPVGLGVPVGTVYDFESVYGTSQTDGRQAVYEALVGAGGAGAGAVLPYRMGGTGGANATKVLNNTSAAAAITLTAKYPGVRGNRYIPVVIDYAPDATRNVLQVYLDTYAGDPVEQFIHIDGDIAGLVAQINQFSSVFTAVVTSAVAPLALTGAGPTAAAGGVDPTPDVGAYTACLNALSTQDFSVLAFQNLTTGSIQTSVLAWVQQMASRQTPITWVVGGDASDTLTTAIARSVLLADPNVINLGVGQYVDDYKNGSLVSTAQLAPRLAGTLIGRGDARSLTFTKMEGLHAPTLGAGTAPPSLTEIEQAIQNGVTVLSASSSSTADLKVERGLSTFTSTSDPNRPNDIFSDPRLVRLTNTFLRDLKAWGDDNVIGGSPVTDNLRESVKVEVIRRIAVMVGRGLVVPGSSDVQVQSPTDPTLADAIPFSFSWQYTRTANYLIGQGRIR